ncbi:GH25 family lysozyme [Anaerotruncus massiliensis (ex Togo et al. 2019)]|uniref:GH25 family lysozyme n=1 Tax=Anaerotruncus massiliensis (ex Togo et al. 2019) TaxID=1673720 RepID=UPI002086C63D|nr:GH25 family lysozyme [Anaerotruncus massiliensis (ex Togo et al. 2019)]GKH47069.1 hypothetical protein CE91St45_16310 [Oscillospiraceae bacterium]
MEIRARGVDVSSNNCGGTGKVDFAAVRRAGYTFAMIRVGYGVQDPKKGFYPYISKSFVPQMEAAAAAGLDVGVYWYSKAAAPEQARTEARALLDAVKPYRLSYPAAFDFECEQYIRGWPPGKQLDVIDGFLEEIEAAGYYGTLYMSQSPLDDLRRYAPGRVDRYDCWVAQYAPRCTYSGAYGMWQHHGDWPGYVGTVEGVAGPIDLNDCYREYPEIMRAAGKNGYPKPDAPTAPETPPEVPDYKLMYEAAEARAEAAEARAARLEATIAQAAALLKTEV